LKRSKTILDLFFEEAGYHKCEKRKKTPAVDSMTT
jgi:hypothetical protein